MTKKFTKITGSSILAMGVFFLSVLPLSAENSGSGVQRAQAFAVTAPLRDLIAQPQPLRYGFHEANPVRRIPKRAVNPIVDPVEQYSAPAGSAFTIGANIIGVGNGFPGYTVPDAPPDTTMAVGDTQIVQWVNVSFVICSKTAPYACGPSFEGNTLWKSLTGTLCAGDNDGDIIAQFDVSAHRWMLTQNVFSSPYAVCIAVSTTPDATGSYYVYQFSVPGGGFPDYPKWGIWPTGYFQAVNNFGPGGSGFQGPQVCAYNSAKLLKGDKTAEQICHQYTPSEDSLLPGDRDSQTAPPSGQDEFYIGSVGDVDTTHLSLYSVHINDESDWSKGATFTGDGNSQLITIANFTPACNGNYGGSCVPQKGITDLVDSLGDRLMYRFAYSNDGSSGLQHWLVNFDVTASAGQGGVRWMDITAPVKVVSPGSLNVRLQGTYAPDGVWRWMGSLARDKMGDILGGFSESCGDTCPGGTPTYPSIALAGHVATGGSPGVGKMQKEVLVVAGTGSQPGTANRWGDYSSMRIDQDGCTFWYTQEYYQTTAQFDWSTRIASAKFNNCK